MRSQLTGDGEANAGVKVTQMRNLGDGLQLRPVLESDREFLFSVFESTRADEFARSGLDAERIAALLAEQFSMQDKYYRSHYPNGCFDVIVLNGHRAGRLYHDWRGNEARLIDIALLPMYRGAGVGTRLLEAIVAHAAARAMPVVLYVEADNAVQALYRRLGFETVGQNGVYLQMRRPGVAFDGARGIPAQALVFENLT